MRRGPTAACLVALTLVSGCVSERAIGIEVRPPRDGAGQPDVPVDVVSWELRLERLEGVARCPDARTAAGALGGDAADVQSFAASDGMGTAIGEVPSGRWALSAIARTERCEPRLFGCAELAIGGEAPELVVIDVTPTDTPETCGTCRRCEAGRCAPAELGCE